MSEGKTGTVKWYSNRKGWGYIGQDEGGDVFVQYSGIVETGFRSLTVGDRVRFLTVQGTQGPAAANVRKLSGDSPRKDTDLRVADGIKEEGLIR